MAGDTSVNVIVYRCPTCNDQVGIVPPGFPEWTEEEIEAKASEHNKKHLLVQEIVEGPSA